MKPMQSVKVWRVKWDSTPPALTTSDDEANLLDEGSPLIRNGIPPPESMYVNMVFTLPVEFKAVDEEVS